MRTLDVMSDILGLSCSADVTLRVIGGGKGS
jgi:hypothetical protein